MNLKFKFLPLDSYKIKSDIRIRPVNFSLVLPNFLLIMPTIIVRKQQFQNGFQCRRFTAILRALNAISELLILI